MTRARTRRRRAGFTLLELLISTVISFALGTAGFLFLRSQLHSLTNQSAGLDAIEAARASLDFMSNDIRMTGANVGGGSRWSGGGTCVGTTSSFTAVWDDGIAANGPAPNHTVRYWYDSANRRIVRTTGGVDTVLIPNVPANGLSFQYFASDGTAATMSGSQVASCDGVAIVQVGVQVTAARATQPFVTSLRSRVTLRNRASTLARM